jgi:hypothetical protein
MYQVYSDEDLVWEGKTECRHDALYQSVPDKAVLRTRTLPKWRTEGKDLGYTIYQVYSEEELIWEGAAECRHVALCAAMPASDDKWTRVRPDWETVELEITGYTWVFPQDRRYVWVDVVVDEAEGWVAMVVDVDDYVVDESTAYVRMQPEFTLQDLWSDSRFLSRLSRQATNFIANKAEKL